MKKTLIITAVLVSILLTLVFAGGCLGQKIADKITEEIIEKAIESEGGEDVDIDLSDGEMTIQTDEGEVNISTDDETVEIQGDGVEATFGEDVGLPEGFPEDIPVYSDMTINTAWAAEGGYSISGISDKSGDEIFNWYKDKLSGWKTEMESTVNTDDGKMSTMAVSNGTYVVTIMVMEDEDEGTVVVQNVNEE